MRRSPKVRPLSVSPLRAGNAFDCNYEQIQWGGPDNFNMAGKDYFGCGSSDFAHPATFCIIMAGMATPASVAWNSWEITDTFAPIRRVREPASPS